ncbi:cation-translocating P-type ATPase [Pyrodictium delaneyi]|nr:cation-transporting P-type ATPase [Pyrodictium delaneyi]
MLEKPHTLPPEEAARRLGVNPATGLSNEEARRRLEICGPNVLETGKRKGFLEVFLEQFKNLFVLMLLAATVFSFYVGETVDAVLILAIVLFMAILGAVQEYRAERILEALKKLASPKARVLRDGRIVMVDASEIVPGDVIIVMEGDRVPADARLLEAKDLYVDESTLTGESVPVHKKADTILPEDTIVSDQINMLFSSTYVVRGTGKAVVTATGRNTYIGRIARMVAETRAEKTPFQVELDRLAKRIAAIVVLIATLSFIIGYVFQEADLVDLLLTSIALAVAAVPEGLPAITVIVFSIAAWNMARRNALVRRLAAVEALGSASVIATDKTGTLTVNEMTVRQFHTPDGRVYITTGEGYRLEGGVFEGDKQVTAESSPLLRLAGLVSILNNNAELENGKIHGDPMEAALLVFAHKLGMDLTQVKKEYRRLREIAFSSERKRMTVVVEGPEGLLVLSKGAPEIIIERSTSYMTIDGSEKPLTDAEKTKLLEQVENIAGKGFRVLALAYRRGDKRDLEASDDVVESRLVLLGMVAIIDPPRPEVPEAVRRALEAGIKVVMVTGDHPSTARAIAEMIGLPRGRVVTGQELEKMSDDELKRIADEVMVFARVTPEHKARIVRVYKELGHIVAVTGDGVNDAPALKLADIGVAMGRRGTEVAKEAADMILLDDNFATIVAAVEEGRRSFDNVKRTVLYLLSANIAEVATVFYATIKGIGTIFNAAMLLWINIVTDGFPAAGMAFEEAEPDVMKRPPRRRGQAILGKPQFTYLLLLSTIETVLTLSFYHLYAAELSPAHGRAAGFLALMYAELAQSMALRRLNTPLSLKIIPSNRQWLAGYIVGAILAAISVTVLADLFRIGSLSPVDIALIFIVSHVAVLSFEEVRKRLGLHV